jgi:hypothetical protein
MELYRTVLHAVQKVMLTVEHVSVATNWTYKHNTYKYVLKFNLQLMQSWDTGELVWSRCGKWKRMRHAGWLNFHFYYDETKEGIFDKK